MLLFRPDDPRDPGALLRRPAAEDPAGLESEAVDELAPPPRPDG